MEAHHYNVEVTWNNERKGMMCSPELNSPEGGNGCIEVATPPQFPKGIPGIWSPEPSLKGGKAERGISTSDEQEDGDVIQLSEEIFDFNVCDAVIKR